MNELVVVAFWKVGAPDGARKNNIAHPCQSLCSVIKDHMSRGVARTMDNSELKGADCYGVTVNKPTVRLKRFSHGKA